ncbi:MAG TPA: efflux RND transporter periplasmic adaptor subunit [Isosphaeraceae bacterium]|nr:efflux RND transporter periplasmic adaptor subunit [Isosphaeraceae bacterium]
MLSHGFSGQTDPAAPSSVVAEEAPMTRWQKFRLVVKVVELRLRFIALMAATALVFAYWDTLWNRYDKWTRPSGEHHATASNIEYYCPMHPQVVQDTTGTCPICGMPLTKRKKGEKAVLPPGVTARVELAPFRVQQAGIKIAEVGYAPMTQTLTTVGYVAFDERGIADIVSKVPGKTRVEKLYVNFTGQDVEAGQPVAELYSPELSQAIEELLNAARRAASSLQPKTDLARSLLSDRQEMVRASSEKLKRWGITQAQIDEILKTGKTNVTIPILSPIRGHVFKKNVVEGQEVQEGYTMLEVADLHTVWVQAQLFEHQLGSVHEGQSVEATVEAFPGKTFPGKVEFIQPHLDPATRTVEVRFALDNPGHRLRPGMFATVTLKTSLATTPDFQTRATARPISGGETRLASLTAEQQKTCPVTSLKLGSMGDPILVEVQERKIWTCCPACPPKLKAQPARYLARLAPAPQDEVLSVPESAVIDTGSRKVVYVESEPGVFEGREVILGPRTGNRFPVLEGLAPGEKIAASGAFLIDAESRINPGAVPARAGQTEAPKPKAVVDMPARSAAVTRENTHGHH